MATRTALALACMSVVACTFDATGLGDGSASQTESSTTAEPVTSTDATSGTASTTSTSAAQTSGTGPDDSSGEGSETTGADLGPFSEPEPVAELNSDVDDDDPSLTADQTQIFFASWRVGGSGGEDIWFSRRSSPEVPFAPPQPAPGLNTPSDETTPVISPDGLTIHFASSRPGGVGGLDVYVATRPSIDAPSWSTPQRIAELSSDMSEGNPVQTADALAIFLCSNRVDGQDDIFSAERASPANPWSTPQVVAGLSSPQRDCNAWIGADATVVFLSSGRPRGSLGGGDIWSSTGDGRSFGAAQNVVELNSMWDEDDPWLSPDLRVIHFSSNRGGNWDLYRAERMR